MDRINFERARKERLIYPLSNIFPRRKADINLFWSKQTFDLGLKSYEGNCDLCWKKSNRKLMTCIKHRPDLVNWWADMENKYGNYIPPGRHQTAILPVRFYRGNKSILEIKSDSEKPFNEALDESHLLPLPSLFPEFIDDNDKNFNCEDSCEAFN
jgi:hypothetical protein